MTDAPLNRVKKFLGSFGEPNDPDFEIIAGSSMPQPLTRTDLCALVEENERLREEALTAATIDREAKRSQEQPLLTFAMSGLFRAILEVADSEDMPDETEIPIWPKGTMKDAPKLTVGMVRRQMNAEAA